MISPCKNRLLQSSWLAVVVWAAALGSAGGAHAAEPMQEQIQSSTAIVRGIVVDARSGAPLDRVQVRIRDTNRKTETDRDGRFELTGVEPGRLVLEASVVNYALIRRPIELAPGQLEAPTATAWRMPENGRRSGRWWSTERKVSRPTGSLR